MLRPYGMGRHGGCHGASQGGAAWARVVAWTLGVDALFAVLTPILLSYILFRRAACYTVYGRFTRCRLSFDGSIV